MNLNWNILARLSAIGAVCSLAVWIGSTSAKQAENSVLVHKPVIEEGDGPVLPPPAKSTAPAPDAPTLPPPAKPKTDFFAPRQPQQKQQAAPSSPAPKRPFMQPAQPREPARGRLTTGAEPIPAPADAPASTPAAPLVAQPKVHPAPPINYETHHKARRMYRSGQIQIVMVAQDPADGCCYEIPLCIPACCTDAPTVSSGRGILGRGVVEYCWSCGFQAKVKFRHLLGDVKVDYEVD